VANGLGARDLAGLPVQLPLRPVYGDILRLRIPQRLRPLVTATVRGLVRGRPVYLVPREDGTVVIGATQREDGSDAVSAGGVYELLRDAQALVPAVAELELYETVARARPGTPDNAPLLGRVSAPEGGDVEGLIVATGFFRHGVLLTPAAARVCREILEGGNGGAWKPFRPDRFAGLGNGRPISHPLHGRSS
jgi:glycine oxidase